MSKLSVGAPLYYVDHGWQDGKRAAVTRVVTIKTVGRKYYTVEYFDKIEISTLVRRDGYTGNARKFYASEQAILDEREASDLAWQIRKLAESYRPDPSHLERLRELHALMHWMQ